MIEKNSFGKTFGPVGSSAGVLIMVVGICAIYYSLSAIILILFGAFVGLTHSSTIIDFGNPSERSNPLDNSNPSDRSKRSDGCMKVKNALNLFGIIPIGKWITIDADMKIGIKKSNLTWRTYSRSNRILDIADSNFVIMLYYSLKQPLMPLKKVDSLDRAKKEQEILCQKLGLSPL